MNFVSHHPTTNKKSGILLDEVDWGKSRTCLNELSVSPWHNYHNRISIQVHHRPSHHSSPFLYLETIDDDNNMTHEIYAKSTQQTAETRLWSLNHWTSTPVYIWYVMKMQLSSVPKPRGVTRFHQNIGSIDETLEVAFATEKRYPKGSFRTRKEFSRKSQESLEIPRESPKTPREPSRTPRDSFWGAQKHSRAPRDSFGGHTSACMTRRDSSGHNNTSKHSMPRHDCSEHANQRQQPHNKCRTALGMKPSANTSILSTGLLWERHLQHEEYLSWSFGGSQQDPYLDIKNMMHPISTNQIHSFMITLVLTSQFPHPQNTLSPQSKIISQQVDLTNL